VCVCVVCVCVGGVCVWVVCVCGGGYYVMYGRMRTDELEMM